MKYQFKEGDGSHGDMTIEQCNIVLNRLRGQGYESFSNESCDFVYCKFMFVENYPLEICRTLKSWSTKNEIPFERWMEILDMNEWSDLHGFGLIDWTYQEKSAMFKNDVTVHAESYEHINPYIPFLENEKQSLFVPLPIEGDTMTYKGVSTKIKEHQERCKSFIEYINMDSDTFVKKMQYSYDVESQQKAIIAEIKEVLTHIPDNKLAGYPEKLRKLAEKLTRL